MCRVQGTLPSEGELLCSSALGVYGVLCAKPAADYSSGASAWSANDQLCREATRGSELEVGGSLMGFRVVSRGCTAIWEALLTGSPCSRLNS